MTLVIFGGAGDLTHRKLLPALYNLFVDGLLPEHVVVVGGMGKFDEGWEAVAKQAFQNFESKLDFTYLTDLTMPVLLERLRHLPSNTIVYHTSI